MEIEYDCYVNRGARVLPLPFVPAIKLTTHDWQGSTETLRRFTDKQRIASSARVSRLGVSRTGPPVPVDCAPVVSVLRDIDLWALMPLSA